MISKLPQNNILVIKEAFAANKLAVLPFNERYIMNQIE